MDWKVEYAELIGCVDVKKMDIDAAMKLKNAHIPNHLYKYRGVNEFSLNNLENNTVWIDKPSEFNDTFEFNENFDIDRIIATISKVRFEELFARVNKIIPIEDSLKEESRYQDDPLLYIFKKLFEKGNMPQENIEKIFEVLNAYKQKMAVDIKSKKNSLMQEKMKVCCFCESNMELGMWSYYADSHKGFCIEYDTDSWFPGDIRRRILYPVIYQDKMFDATPHFEYYILNGDFNNLYPIISGSTKSNRYRNENEWRFIFNIGDSFHPQNYKMSCLNRVFLGAKISNEDKFKILEICNRKKIDVLQAQTSLDGYSMEFQPVNY